MIHRASKQLVGRQATNCCHHQLVTRAPFQAQPTSDADDADAFTLTNPEALNRHGVCKWWHEAASAGDSKIFKTCSCRISQWCHISLQISTYILDPAKALEMRIWLVVSSSVKFWAASSSLHGNITSKAPEWQKSGKTKLSAADWCYRFKPFKRNSRVPITSK